MIDRDWSRIRDELTQLHLVERDALAVAIYLEDATGITLDDDLLQDPSLGTGDGVADLIDRLAERL